MGRVAHAATWLIWTGSMLAWLAWAGIYLPSRFAYDFGIPFLTHGLWERMGSLLTHLEPLSRNLPAWALVGLLPLAIALTAAGLILSSQRLPTAVALSMLPLTGLPWLYYVYPTAVDRMNRYQDGKGILSDTLLGHLVDVLPGTLLDVGRVFVLPLSASVAGIVLLGVFRRPLVTEPLRGAFLSRSSEATKWMDAKTTRKLRPPGLTLGRQNGRILHYPYGDPNFYGGHHFAFAGTRGGKGVSVIVPAIVDHEGPVSVVDIKGENWLITRRARSAKGYRVVALNPWGLFEPNETGLNLFDFLRPSALSDDAKLLAAALIREETNEVGAHLVDLARKLIAAAIEVVYTVDEPANHHIMTVYDLIMGAGAKDAFTAWAQNPQLCGGRPARAVGSFLGKDEKEFNLVKSTISRNLGFLDSDRMQTFVKTSGLKPTDILSGNTDIFIIVPLEHLADQANFLRVVVALQLNTILSSAERRLSHPLLMVLDEFPALGAMEQMKNLFTVGAGSNLTLLGITQDLSRLQDVWGRDAALSMLSQCATLRVFGLGAGDIATAEWTARLLPEILKRRENRTYKADHLISDQVSYSEASQRLIPAEDILRMGMRSMLCLVRGKNPLLLERIISHDDPAYAGKIDTSPYFGK